MYTQKRCSLSTLKFTISDVKRYSLFVKSTLAQLDLRLTIDFPVKIHDSYCNIRKKNFLQCNFAQIDKSIIIIIIIIIILSGAYLNGTSKYAINQKCFLKEKAPPWEKRKRNKEQPKSKANTKQKKQTIAKPKQSILGKKKNEKI